MFLLKSLAENVMSLAACPTAFDSSCNKKKLKKIKRKKEKVVSH